MYLLRDDIESLDEQQTDELIKLLPAWRREIALRYKHLAGRRESATAYLLLQKALQLYYGINEAPHFVVGTHGKPTLQEYPHIHFNTSHCRSAIICAVSHTPVGVDIEHRRAIKKTLIQHTMNATERERIEQSEDPEMEFLRLWTAKEAVVKLSGKGLQGNIPDILSLEKLRNIHITTYTNTEKDYVYSLAQHAI